MRRIKPALVLSALFLGLSSSLAQVLLLREVMSAFGGHEGLYAFLMAGWLLATGVGAALHLRPGRAWTLRILVGTGVLFLASFFAARMLRVWIGLPAGMVVDAFSVGPLAGLLVVPLCLGYGALFSALVSWVKEDSAAERGIGIYVWEALGFVAGGAGATLFFLCPIPALAIACALALGHFALFFFFIGRPALVFVLLGVSGFSGLFLVTRADQALWKRQWPGMSAVRVEDTVYGRVMGVIRHGQANLFEDGHLSYSSGDFLGSEETVHYGFLTQGHPRQVLIVGCDGGVLTEALKYPEVLVDCVEQDPERLVLLRALIPSEAILLDHDRVRVIKGEARRHIRGALRRYDVIVSRAPDPLSLSLNRYFTREYFEEARRALRPGGVFVTFASGGENAINPEAEALLATLEVTLQDVFPAVRLLWGERMVFLAAEDPAQVSLDGEGLLSALHAHGVSTRFLEPYAFLGRFDPIRMRLAERIAQRPAALNTDARPYAVIRAAVFVSTRFSSVVGRVLALAERPLVVALAILLVGAGILVLAFSPAGVPGAVAVTCGMTQMMAQVSILLYFQSLFGVLFGWIGALNGTFMLGAALGAASVSFQREVGFLDLRRIQLLAVLFLVSLIILSQGTFFDERLTGPLFFLASLIAGVIGGRQFGMTVRTARKRAGILYGLDVAGAALGVLLCGLFFIPLIGLAATLLIAAMLNFLVWAVSLSQPANPSSE
ncbi:MAG: hypothetical protein GX606_06780 [Elusimicrobia bacterium]|nr:hypothetical protein [Elusimicrobiota bacterium]